MAHEPAYTGSYRSVRRSRGLDSGTRRLLAIAGGLGVALVVAVGGWSLLGSGPRVVPVIAAPSGPVRVKPAHRGGMRVVGVNQDVMASATGSDAVTMQAPPEQPALGALHALEGARARIAAAAPAAAPPLAAPASSAPTPAAAPAQVAPPPASAAAATAPVLALAAPIPLAPAPAAPAGGQQVQLAAMATQAAAQAEWQRLAQQMPALLGGRTPLVQQAAVDGRTVWRLRTGGFPSIAEATRFCQQVRAQGGGCSIAAF